MAIDHIATCIFVIAGVSREDRGRITAGYSEVGLQLFFISQLCMVRFSNGFQQNDGNKLLSMVLMSDKAQIYVLFSLC